LLRRERRRSSEGFREQGSAALKSTARKKTCHCESGAHAQFHSLLRRNLSLLDELGAACEFRSMNVEYTDAPTAPPEPSAGDKMPCPYCGHLLPKDAERCDRCDWVRGATQTAEGKASDMVAVMFSIVPGLGHIYKGHIFAGLLWMLGAIPVGIFVFLAAFASAGWGLGLFFFYLAAAMLHAYGIDDRVVPPKEDEGEEY
jgi:TM2 domain-containing membrane protein YozV